VWGVEKRNGEGENKNNYSEGWSYKRGEYIRERSIRDGRGEGE